MKRGKQSSRRCFRFYVAGGRVSSAFLLFSQGSEVMRVADTSLASFLEKEYGVGLAGADPVAVLWAAESVAFWIGVAHAKKELRAVNRWRERKGLPLAHPPYGSQLF